MACGKKEMGLAKMRLLWEKVKHWEKVRNTGLLCGDTVEDVA